MTNELTLFFQLFLVFAFCYGAFRLGREALIGAVTFLTLLANLFVLKQIPLFSFVVTASDAFAIGSILSINLLREFYGKESAKKAISICFFTMIFFVTFSGIHLAFNPSFADSAHLAYARLLKPAPRLLFASLLVFFVIQQLDLRLFGWISRVLPRSSFPVRSGISLITSQFFDTLLFSLIGLYGLMANLTHVTLISFLLKAAMVFAIGPLLTLFKKMEHNVRF